VPNFQTYSHENGLNWTGKNVRIVKIFSNSGRYGFVFSLSETLSPSSILGGRTTPPNSIFAEFVAIASVLGKPNRIEALMH
jgi:hypothetical protein